MSSRIALFLILCSAGLTSAALGQSVVPAVPPTSSVTTPTRAAALPLPADPGPPASSSLAPSPGVLILRNGNLLRGQVSRLGDRYLVALDARNEVRLPVADVEFHCETLQQAYAYKRAALPPGQTAARLDLAEWCLHQGLVKQAADEATLVMRLDPDHPRLAGLEQRIDSASHPAPASPPAAKTGAAPASFDQLEQTARDMPFGAVERFTATIQPMLLNRCGTNSCHGPGSPSEYHLLRPALGQTTTRRFTLRNLHATLQFIARQDPGESRLLTLAHQPHGAAKVAPFGANEQAQYEILAAWVRQSTKPKSPNSPATIGRADSQLLQTTSLTATPVSSPSRLPSSDSPSETTATRKPAQENPVAGRDPFDPELFNRKYVDSVERRQP